ncbi:MULTISPECIES: sodium:solute symporter family protein [Pseudomonas]|jgi:SSS family solute:Na+ symporter|uniref:Sodium:solute symporter n=1 Tax=Pseudomonas frederiksbergensis TaxID=104087 RepID=A0A0B1YX19_9PSED|nr:MULTISPECIES: sodium:solute symporter [Pseudomonas]KHK62950.1 sodium:solute symporter [Pseudomonas frederiksbergensis]KJH87260.1 sodium:solute symporter [Pseudomonas fluorescens]MBI6618406.1 sodium:solute symporter [Pseudomonas corrugata]MBI6695270.1 sodium:solute symporter [Pseudomonas corrugata]WRV66973.1 sodium:solute symporter [Pseudomonas frederiksbergensis]
MALDLIVVLIYAAGMIALGWYGMRRAKTRDDYLVAGRNLGPGFYLGTMAATVLGGASTIGTVRLGYVHGISGFWLCGAIGLGIVGLSLFLAKPLLKLKIYTVTQVLERRYNPAARHASALIMLVYALMIGATSTIAIGTVMQVLFGLPFWVSILVGGGVVVLYSTIGGMWSLTLTDIVQFLIMTIGLVFLLMPMSISDAGGWDAMVAALPARYFDFTAIGWDTIITYFLIYFFGIFIGQDIWQRVFTARSEGVAKVAGTAAGLYCVLYGLAGALIGMAAKVLLPDLENVNNAFASVVQHSLPNGIRGLVIAAALAALMSTAAAGLLAASTTVVQDLLPRLRQGRESGNGDVHENRIATLLLGAVVLAIALVVSDVISALTLAYNLLVGGMLIPLIGAIYWKRATTAGAITSMSLGFVTALFFMFKDGLDANTPIYYSLSVALVSFVVVSLLSPRSNVVPKAA